MKRRGVGSEREVDARLWERGDSYQSPARFGLPISSRCNPTAKDLWTAGRTPASGLVSLAVPTTFRMKGCLYGVLFQGIRSRWHL